MLLKISPSSDPLSLGRTLQDRVFESALVGSGVGITSGILALDRKEGFGAAVRRAAVAGGRCGAGVLLALLTFEQARSLGAGQSPSAAAAGAVAGLCLSAPAHRVPAALFGGSAAALIFPMLLLRDAPPASCVAGLRPTGAWLARR